MINKKKNNIEEKSKILKISSKSNKYNFNKIVNNLDFVYNTKNIIKNVYGFDLVNYTIPFDWYTINSKNNILKWSTLYKRSTEKIIKEYTTYLPHGTYEIDKLSNIIAEYMTDEEINIYLISEWVTNNNKSCIKISRNSHLSKLDNCPTFDIKFNKIEYIDVINFSPCNLACNIAINTKIILTFNIEIKFKNDFLNHCNIEENKYIFSNINNIDNNIKLYKVDNDNQTQIPIVIYIKNNDLIIEPSILEHNTKYGLEINNKTMVDINDNDYIGISGYNFTTNLDNIDNLNILSFNPNQDSILNDISENIEIVFNKNIDFSDNFKEMTDIVNNKYQYKITEKTNKISLISEYGQTIPILIHIELNKLIIKPINNFEYDINYQIKIDCGDIKILGLDNICLYCITDSNLDSNDTFYNHLDKIIYQIKTNKSPENDQIYNYRLEKKVNNQSTKEEFKNNGLDQPGFTFWFNIGWNGWSNPFKNFFESKTIINTDLIGTGRYTLFFECYNNGFLYYNGKRFVKDSGEKVFGLWKLQSDDYLFIFWWNSEEYMWQIGRTEKYNKIDKTAIDDCKSLEELNISKIYPKSRDKWVHPLNERLNFYQYIEICIDIDNIDSHNIMVFTPPKINDMPWAISIDNHCINMNNTKSSFFSRTIKKVSDEIITETYYLNTIPNIRGELNNGLILFKGLNCIEHNGITYTKKTKNLNNIFPLKYINKYDVNINRLAIQCKWNNILENSYNRSVYIPYFRFENTKMENLLLKSLGLSNYNVIKLEFYIAYSGTDVDEIFQTVNIDYIERIIKNDIENYLEKLNYLVNINLNIDLDLKQIYIKSINNPFLRININNIINIIKDVNYFKNKDIQFNAIDSKTNYYTDESYLQIYIGDKNPLPIGDQVIYLHINFSSNTLDNENVYIIPININCKYNGIITNPNIMGDNIYHFSKLKNLNKISFKITYPDSDIPIMSKGGLESYFTIKLFIRDIVKKSGLDTLKDIKLEIMKNKELMNKYINANDVFTL